MTYENLRESSEEVIHSNQMTLEAPVLSAADCSLGHESLLAKTIN